MHSSIISWLHLSRKIYYKYKSSSYNMVEIRVMYNLNHNLLKMQ
jgi:hypothetical protein